MSPGLILSDGREVSNRKDPLDLSLVVTCYNDSKTIENTLSDWYLALQGLGITFEVLVINKGSRDGTGRILDQMRKNLEHLRVVHQLPSQDAQARLRGFKLARGSYVLLLGMDCPIVSDDFKPLWEAHENKLAVVGNRTQRSDRFLHLPFAFALKKFLEKVFACKLQDPGSPVLLLKRTSVKIPKETASIPLSFWLQQIIQISNEFSEHVGEVPVHLNHTSWAESPYRKISLSSKILRELLEVKLKEPEEKNHPKKSNTSSPIVPQSY